MFKLIIIRLKEIKSLYLLYLGFKTGASRCYGCCLDSILSVIIYIHRFRCISCDY